MSSLPPSSGSIRRSAAAVHHLHLLKSSLFRGGVPPLPPTYAYNAIIRAYADGRSPWDAVRIFSELRRRTAGDPDNYTYPFVLKACGKCGMAGVGRAVHGLAVKAGWASDLYVGNTLLHMYAKCRTIGTARKVFDEMPCRNVVSWSSMIEGDHPLDALMVFVEMRQSNTAPNFVTLVSLLAACSHLVYLRAGRSIHSYIIVNKIELVVALGTALVGMYSKCGCISDAFKLFNMLHEKNIQTWTIMISAFSDHGYADEALSLFTQMEGIGLKPDSVIFSCILSACSHLGLVDKGQYYFTMMVDNFGIVPRMEHYGCMIDMLGRAGLIEAACEFINNMPIPPNSVALRSFVGACSKHSTISSSDGVLKARLLELELEVESNYVLASNVSALSGDWNDVHRLRSGILERGLQKKPGCSSVN